eukprot:scaffold62193_cov19-Tisochrysis_lutea.AAC.1
MVQKWHVRILREVLNSCVLFLLLFFPLYIIDVDSIAEDLRGAVTGAQDVCDTHMLYADLTLLSNEA